MIVLMDKILEQTSGDVFDVNELIPTESLFETIIKLSLYICAAFQLVCLASLMLPSAGTHQAPVAAAKTDANSQVSKVIFHNLFPCEIVESNRISFTMSPFLTRYTVTQPPWRKECYWLIFISS